MTLLLLFKIFVWVYLNQTDNVYLEVRSQMLPDQCHYKIDATFKIIY